MCCCRDTPLQHTSLISTLQTRTDLAGEMSFKKRCHFNQGFCVCLLSRRTHCSSCNDCCCDRGSRARESGGSSVLWGVNWQNYLKMLNWTLSVLQLLSQEKTILPGYPLLEMNLSCSSHQYSFLLYLNHRISLLLNKNKKCTQLNWQFQHLCAKEILKKRNCKPIKPCSLHQSN